MYLVKNSVRQGIFTKLSGARLFDELRNILEEDAAAGAIGKLYELGVLALIHKDISWGVERAAFLKGPKRRLHGMSCSIQRTRPRRGLRSFSR